MDGDSESQLRSIRGYLRSFKTGIPHEFCRIAHARGDARGQIGVHRTSWSVIVYIKLGVKVGEGGKRMEKTVKRKPPCRDDEIICLIEGIGN